MTTSAFGTIHTYPNNPRVAKAVIAGKYNGLVIEEAAVQMGVTNKSKEFLAKFPLGKVPAFEAADGFTLYESGAIAYYVASQKEGTQLLGKNKKEAALIQQYIAFADNELNPSVATWLYPILGYMPYNEANTKKAKEDLKKSLTVLNNHLLNNTFLVGEAVTLADITVISSLVNCYRMLFDPEYRAPFKNLTRWFITCVNQPHFKSVLGDITLCEKTAVPPKEEPKAAAAPAAKQEKPKKEKSKKKDDDEEDDTMAEILAQEDKPAGKNPLDLLPPSKFNLEAWKRFYSNNDTRPTAINYFWDNYDAEGFSMWKVNYKYNNELTLTFMSSNLIGGFFQRLERARKYAFGSMAVLGEDKKNEISGFFVFRGQDVPFEVTDAADYESYTFTKVDTKDAKARELYNAYIAWDDVIEGKKFADGKIFK